MLEFECQHEGCGGKLKIADHACRFAHGLVARCSESPQQQTPSGYAELDGVHRYKWCTHQYAFVRSEEWQHHLAWCRGSAPAERPALAVVDPELVHKSASDRAAAKARREEEERAGEGAGGEREGGGEGEEAGHPRGAEGADEAAVQRERKEEREGKAGKDAGSGDQVLENGRAGSEPPHSETRAGEDTGGSKRTGGSPPVDARDTNGDREGHAAAVEAAARDADAAMPDAATTVPGGGPESEDPALREEISAILGENSEAILNGDTQSNKYWSRQLKEFRGRTLVSEMQSRSTINPSADASGDSAAALLVTIMRGDLDGLVNQISQGADVNAFDANKNTPLHWAAAAGSTDVARMLLDAGADLRKRGSGGNQAIHVAAAHGRMAFVQLCVSRGADMDVKNHEGLSARHLLNTLVHQYT